MDRRLWYDIPHQDTPPELRAGTITVDKPIIKRTESTITIEFNCHDSNYEFETNGVRNPDVPLNRWDKDGGFIVNATVNGQSQSQTIAFKHDGKIILSWSIPINEAATLTGNYNAWGHYWRGWDNSLYAAIEDRKTGSYSETIGAEIIVSTNDVTIQITNSSYTQDSTGLRTYNGTVNYSIQNLSAVPLGTQIDLWVQYEQTDGIVTHLQKILKTLNTQNGSFSFSFFESSPYNVLTNATMRAQVFFWLRNTATPISLNAGTQFDLVVDNPPVDPEPNMNMVALRFENFDYQNKDVMGSIVAEKTSSFDTFFNDVPMVFFAQIKDRDTGVVIHLIQKNFSFGTNPFFSLGVNVDFGINGAERILVEAFVWTSNNEAMSQTISGNYDSLNPPLQCPVGQHEENGVCVPDEPTELANTSFRLVFTDDSSLAFVLSDSDFATFITPPLRYPNVALQDVLDTSAPAIPLSQLYTVVDAKLDTMPNDSVDTSMIAQSIGFFEIKDDRLTGSINYIANSTFNPFYYGTNIKSFVQVKDFATGTVIVIKQNDLNFTETERDEVINIDEFIGGVQKVNVSFFVWKSATDNSAFAEPKEVTIEFGGDNPEPCQTGYHRVNGICVPNDPPPAPKPDNVIGALKGIFVGSLALALLTSEMPKSKKERLQ